MISLICYQHFVPIGTDKSLVKDDMFIEKLPPKGIKRLYQKLMIQGNSKERNGAQNTQRFYK